MEAEEQIVELEDKMLEMIAEEQYNIESRKRMEDNLRDFSNKIKHTKNQSMGVPEEEDKKI